MVGYDANRGDPRGGREAKQTGACIECSKCVAVCPQGIDIRKGFQLECLTCGRCVDACTQVMDKLGHPTLIRYTTQAADAGQPPRSLRWRTMVYGGIMTVLTVAALSVFFTHEAFEVTVNRAPGSLFVLDDGDLVRNTFLVSVADTRTRGEALTYAITVDGLPDGAETLGSAVELGPGDHTTVPLVLRLPTAEMTGTTLPITVAVGTSERSIERDATFKGPGGGS